MQTSHREEPAEVQTVGCSCCLILAKHWCRIKMENGKMIEESQFDAEGKLEQIIQTLKLYKLIVNISTY